VALLEAFVLRLLVCSHSVARTVKLSCDLVEVGMGVLSCLPRLLHLLLMCLGHRHYVVAAGGIATKDGRQLPSASAVWLTVGTVLMRRRFARIVDICAE
jgi:hypothetical protein